MDFGLHKYKPKFILEHPGCSKMDFGLYFKSILEHPGCSKMDFGLYFNTLVKLSLVTR
jgi:hypothetical protein